MFKTWSIKHLLQYWAAASVIVVIAMALMVNYVNGLIVSSQYEFSKQLQPLENSNHQLNTAVSSLINRQKQILASDTLAEMASHTERDVYEQAFQQHWMRLSQVLQAEADRALTASLYDYYQDFLALDSEIYQYKQNSLVLADRLEQHADDVSIQLGKLRQQLNALETQLMQFNYSASVRLVDSMRMAIYELGLLNYKVFTADQDQTIETMLQRDVRPTVQRVEQQLGLLQQRVSSPPLVIKFIAEIEKELGILQDLLIEQDGLFSLQTQRILTYSLLEQSQHGAISVMSVLTKKLSQLAQTVNQLTLDSVSDNVSLADRIRWQLMVLSLFLTLVMGVFAYSLFRGIYRPIQSMRESMRALSEGHFETRMTEQNSDNEVSALARDFNRFADKTERLLGDYARAEHSLQTQQQQILAILNGVPEAILTLDKDGYIQEINPAAEQILGGSEQELSQQSILSFVETDEMVSFDDIIVRAEGGNEFDGRRLDGSSWSMWMSLSKTTRVDNDLWVCVISDVTDWKQTDQQLQQTTVELNAILENAMVGIAFIRDRHVIRVNHKFEELFQYARDQIQGQSTVCLYPNQSAYEQFGEQAYQVLAKGDNYEAELELVRQNGETFWCAVSGKAINGDKPAQGTIWLFEDITKQRENEERLIRLASIDTLTGLPNRAVFNDRLEHALHKARRQSERLAVFFLDLDHFKNINDSLGHKAGDVLLNEVAARIRGCLREGDTVARLGGDEFTVLLEDIRSAEYVGKVAEKVIAAMTEPYNIEATEVNISPSIGISLYPADGRDVEMLIRNADAAMYHAKRVGRNNFQFYSSEMNAEAAQRLSMETALRRAVDQKEFFVQYQPQIELQTGRVTGAEVLLRWDSAQWGEVEPSKFIPILEDNGLIGEVGEWILREACTTFMELREQLPDDFMMAVNLSGRQFKGGRLAGFVRQLLAEVGMPATNLELEITETLLMEDTALAVDTLGELSDMNISLAIDDFGTGYSSLSYLKQFPLNVLKIDSTFVRDVTKDEDDAAIVDAIMAMCNSLSMSVVAEGVETADQLEFLKARQCQRAQGFLFSRPVDKQQLIATLAQGTRF